MIDLVGGWVQAAAQDSSFVGAHQQIALDSTAAPRAVADPVIRVVQWIFQRPPWVMWGGAILAGIVAALLLWQFWIHRHDVARWLVTRRRTVQFGLVAAAVAVIGVAAALSYRAYDFVEHDNRFCTGCHIFVPSGEAWVLPDTGYYSLVNRLEGKHDTLSCHACHALKPMKEAVKMIYWMSGVRDKEIPPHAKVPRDVCERCHVTGSAKKFWQEIAATAGHRVHLESDSSALKNVQCLTCHATTAHRFQPVDSTCAQSGCHTNVKIKLGGMAQQTDLHCITCHNFTATVPALATRDSAARTLVPTIQRCSQCHRMKELIAEFDPARDPHNATCGDCHNPHTQAAAGQAVKSCTAAGCHADWRKVDFHTGATHRAVAQQCTTCHIPHRARVDASDCTGCHARVRSEKGNNRLHPPAPFDTTRALQTSLAPTPQPGITRTWPERDPPRGKGDVLPDDADWTPAAAPAAPAADTFSHARHKKLPCITCHDVSSPKRVLTFQPPRGCQICHHQRPTRADCAECHQQTELADSLQLDIAIGAAGHPSRERAVSFSHPTHRELACIECHTTPVTLAPSDSVRACRDCHDQHHAAQRDCADCHRGEPVRTAHEPPVEAHRNCDECHTPATVARLVPTRSLCLTCHQPQQDHYPARECSTCHFLQSPDQYRSHLRKGSA